MMERIEAECFPHKAEQPKRKTLGASSRDGRGLKLAEDDVAMLRDAVSQAFEDIASRYYLQGGVVPEVRVSSDGVRIFIPVEKIR